MINEEIILGVDPGLLNTGWGIIASKAHALRFIASGNITTISKEPIGMRLKKIHLELAKIIALYNPDQCAMEDIFVNKNNASSLKLGYARAAAILTIGLAEKKFFEYSPNLVKKAVVGRGKADKTQVEYMVSKIFPKANVLNDHVADALAVAICHAHYKKFNLEDLVGSYK